MSDGPTVFDQGVLVEDANLSRRIRYVPVDSETDVPAAMCRRGVWYLFVSRPYPQQLEPVEALLHRGGVRKAGDGLWIHAKRSATRPSVGPVLPASPEKCPPEKCQVPSGEVPGTFVPACSSPRAAPAGPWPWERR